MEFSTKKTSLENYSNALSSLFPVRTKSLAVSSETQTFKTMLYKCYFSAVIEGLRSNL